MRVFVQSFGCSTNFADGEVLAGCLAKAGCRLVDSPAKADVVVYNTCAVKGPTENRMIHTLKTVPKDKRLVVAGCLPLINLERLQREVKLDGVVGPAAGDQIVDVVRGVSKGQHVIALEKGKHPLPSLSLPRKRSSSVISIIPIGYGCLGSCAYCCVTFARGSLRSYSMDDIAKRAKIDVASGTQEIWVTSQDTACYGRDKGTDLAELLRALCKIEGNFQMRVGMMTPNMAKKILDDLVCAFEDERIFKFLHLPVQSGDDNVLMRMQRRYTAADFEAIVDAFRTKFPELTLSTDVICGFPGETEEAFQRTLCLIEETQPDTVNVSKFFARPRTAAAQIVEGIVPPAQVRERAKAAWVLAKRIGLERNNNWIGWKGRVLVDEVGKVSGSWIGRNFAYKPIVIKDSREVLGRRVDVKVVRAFPTHLQGTKTRPAV